MQENVTLVTVNFSQKPALELMLKSYVACHYEGSPLNILLADNGSTDDSTLFLLQNNIPFIDLKENIGHEQALNVLYPLIKTKYALFADTDLEFLTNVVKWYLPKMQQAGSTLAGDYIATNHFHHNKIVNRCGAWFFLLDVGAMKEQGVNHFRDPYCHAWNYDVGSWMTEQVEKNGFKILHTPRLNEDIDNDLISMSYETHLHIGKVSWDLTKHGDRESEVMKRRKYIEDKLKEFEHIDLNGKFV